MAFGDIHARSNEEYKKWSTEILAQVDSILATLSKESGREASAYRDVVETLVVLTETMDIVSFCVQDLCRQSARFDHIRRSLEEYRDGEQGLCHHFEYVIAQHREAPEPDSLPAASLITKFDERFHQLVSTLTMIAFATTYEIYATFDIDLTDEDWKHIRIDRDFFTRLTYVYTKNRPFRPRETHALPYSRVENDSISSRYQKPLRSDIGEIRILRVLPGNSEEAISCELNLINLNDGVDFEALSYVWGTDISTTPVYVDGEAIQVTSNLYRALRTLRYPDKSRPLWVDAVCINQADEVEKSAQVNMMRYIYSLAVRTIIWMGEVPESLASPSDTSTEGLETITEWDRRLEEGSPYNYPEPVRQNFGLPGVDRSDFSTLVTRCQLAKSKEKLDWEDLVSFLLLSRCINAILQAEWWTRVWVIQEAALSSSDPTLYFGQHSFSWATFTESFQVVGMKHGPNSGFSLRDYMKGKPDVHSASDLSSEEISISNSIQYEKLQASSKLLHPVFALRQSALLEKDQPYRYTSLSLQRPLGVKSTDPRDRIFGLQGLLPKSIRYLLPADYSQSARDVFARATAFSLPEQNGMTLYKLYPLRLLANGDHRRSWVIDFSSPRTFSPTMSLTVHGDFDSKLLTGAFWKNQSIQVKRPSIPFATPHFMTCSAIFIDQVIAVDNIPNMRADLHDISSTSEMEGILFDWHSAVARHVSSDRVESDRAGVYSTEASRKQIDWDKLQSDSIMKSLALGYPIGSDGSAERTSFWKVMAMLSGKYYIVTRRGLIGISASPVSAEDDLVVLWGCGIPFVIRGSGDDVRYWFVNGVWVDGMMEGELVPQIAEGKLSWRTISFLSELECPGS